ncbi:MAG: hypothetical protein ABIR17_07085 [Pseudolysinimonas sp.]|uniref:hypothetical protein n=1 Tax=Pseudolysinimonas sp. TaxID=2680009 RepID=UPI00326306E1
MVMWMFWGLGVLFTAATVIVPSWTWALSSWQFESPDDMEPSPRRWRVVRAGAAVILVGLIAILVAAIWPGEGIDKANAALATIFIGDALLIAWFIVMAVSRTQAQRRAIDDANPPPSEPSSLGYTFAYASVAVSACAVLVVGLIVAGAAQQIADHRAANSPEAHQAEIDSAMRTINHLQIPYPILDAVPATGGVVDPMYYSPVSAENRSPRVVWDQSTPSVDRPNDELLAGADLVIATYGLACDPIDIVVIETDTTVTVGVAVAEEPDANGKLQCTTSGVASLDWFPIDLAAPLNGRNVRGVNKLYVTYYVPPNLP